MQTKMSYFFFVPIREDGRGSITLGQSPKIYTFFILKASLSSKFKNFLSCVAGAYVFSVNINAIYTVIDIHQTYGFNIKNLNNLS